MLDLMENNAEKEQRSDQTRAPASAKSLMSKKQGGFEVESRRRTNTRVAITSLAFTALFTFIALFRTTTLTT
jgi:hypothetical protein